MTSVFLVYPIRQSKNCCVVFPYTYLAIILIVYSNESNLCFINTIIIVVAILFIEVFYCIAFKVHSHTLSANTLFICYLCHNHKSALDVLVCVAQLTYITIQLNTPHFQGDPVSSFTFRFAIFIISNEAWSLILFITTPTSQVGANMDIIW